MPEFRAIFVGTINTYAEEIIEADTLAEASEMAELILRTEPLDWEQEDSNEEVWVVEPVERTTNGEVK